MRDCSYELFHQWCGSPVQGLEMMGVSKSDGKLFCPIPPSFENWFHECSRYPCLVPIRLAPPKHIAPSPHCGVPSHDHADNCQRPLLGFLSPLLPRSFSLSPFRCEQAYPAALLVVKRTPVQESQQCASLPPAPFDAHVGPPPPPFLCPVRSRTSLVGAQTGFFFTDPRSLFLFKSSSPPVLQPRSPLQVSFHASPDLYHFFLFASLGVSRLYASPPRGSLSPPPPPNIFPSFSQKSTPASELPILMIQRNPRPSLSTTFPSLFGSWSHPIFLIPLGVRVYRAFVGVWPGTILRC